MRSLCTLQIFILDTEETVSFEQQQKKMDCKKCVYNQILNYANWNFTANEYVSFAFDFTISTEYSSTDDWLLHRQIHVSTQSKSKWIINFSTILFLYRINALGVERLEGVS